MERALDRYPEVDEDLLAEAVRRILGAGSPVKIVLFGSRARGTERKDSDLDLLIIEQSSTLPRYKRATPYRLALRGLFPSKDIVVWTLPEIEAWSEVPEAFITTILAEGKILYERP